MPANDRLRSALSAAGHTAQDLAERLNVDPKTAARWVTLGRVPYPKYRAQIAALVRESESYLWPDAISDTDRQRAAESEIVHVYPHRADIPAEVWPRLFDSAHETIDVLVYAALFLPEQQPKLMAMLCDKAASGARIRVLLGHPDCEAVAVRSKEEGLGRDTIGVKIENAKTFYRPHADHGCLNVRLHDTTLYTSIYRADDEMLVNHHVYGLPAAHAPVMHLRRLPAGDLFTTFSQMFERIWSRAKPAFAHDGEAVA